jgi:hypothetical protein
MDKIGTLEQALTALSQKELINLLLKLSNERADFYRALVANINLSPQARNVQRVRQLKQEISEFFDTFQSQYDCFDHEYDEDEKYPELDPILEAAQSLHPIDTMEVLWHLVTCSQQIFEDEECLIGTQQIEDAIHLYVKAVNELNLSSQDKQPYFDILITALSSNLCSYGEVSDAVEDAIADLCSTSEDYEYLIENLQKSNYSRATELIAGYYLQLGDEENYLQVRQANLKTESQYLELANYWLQQKQDIQKYIETLELGVTYLAEKRIQPINRFSFLSINSSTQSSELLQTLADYYQLQQDWQNLSRIWMATAEYCGVTLDLYKKIKDLSVKTGQWQTLQPQLIAIAQRNPETLARIYLSESDLKTAVQLAFQHPQNERLQVLVAEGVKEYYPCSSIQIYQQLVQNYINRQSRDYYRTAARHAEAIKSIYQDILEDSDTWRHYIDALRQQYPRHRALQDEFRRL